MLFFQEEEASQTIKINFFVSYVPDMLWSWWHKKHS